MNSASNFMGACLYRYVNTFANFASCLQLHTVQEISDLQQSRISKILPDESG